MSLDVEQTKSKYSNQSISHGTLRQSDLIVSFYNVLFDIDEETAVTWKSNWPTEWDWASINTPKAMETPFERGTNVHKIDEALEELFQLLDERSPEGYGFGSHEGDGSDFGFWSVRDAN